MNSSKNGYCFEYCSFLIFNNIGIRCSDYQLLRHHWDSSDNLVKLKTIRACSSFISYLLETVCVGANIEFVTKPSCNTGKLGECCDLIINLSNNQKVNVSLKSSVTSNCFSLKHQRPENVPMHLGITDSDIINTYKENIRTIKQQIFNLNQTVATFAEITNKDTCVYFPMTEFVMKFLKNFQHDECAAKTFFRFLIGKEEDKIVVFYTNNKLKCYNFSNITTPSCFSVTRLKDSTLQVAFNNRFTFVLRLHNASSRFTKQVSLKFDTTLPSINDLLNVTEIKH